MTRISMTCLFLVAVAALAAAGCGGDENATGGGGEGGIGASGGRGPGGGVGGATGFCEEQPSQGGRVGGQCRGTPGTCDTGFLCFQEQTDTVGTSSDPFEPFEVTTFVDGYCTLEPAATPSGCNVEACFFEHCGECVGIGDGLAACFKSCIPELDTNSACRDGYACDSIAQVCLPGCSTDEECRGRFDEGEFVYNDESVAVCNTENYRCEHPGTPDAEAGDACAFDDDCEPNGSCLGGPDGFCTKFGCDLVGNACDGSGTCVGGQCWAPCVVGSDDLTPPESNNQGCDEGFTCYWDRVGTSPDGVCDTGIFNETITEPNVGTICTEDAECYSPYGYGRCDPDFGCTIIECGAPGVPEEICGTGATCVDFIELGIDLFACLKTCAIAEECNDGDACLDLDGMDTTTDDRVCFPGCNRSEDCRENEVCNLNNECEAP